MERGTGKTDLLVKMAWALDVPLIVTNASVKRYIKEKYEKFDITLYTANEVRNGALIGIKISDCLVDDYEHVLESLLGLNILVATTSLE